MILMVYIPCIMNIKILPIDEIIYKYQKLKYTVNRLADEYKCSATTIKRYLILNNVWEKRPCYRKYNLNENYFDKIDTEDKAYFLGLLYADGYNCESGNYVNLELHYKDKEILEKFNKYIGSDKPLMYHKKKGAEHSWRLNLASKKISYQLKLLGCYQKKSLTLKFPTKEQVPEHLIKHFIRGYFDGDGSIWFLKNSNRIKCMLCIVSSKEFCEKLQEYMKGKIRTKKNWTNTRMVTLTKSEACIFFLNWMYENATIYLDRKYNMYLEYNERIKLFKTNSKKMARVT